MPHRAGKTSWKRFAAVLVPGVTAAAALGISMAQGALAASFFISGQKFQVAVDTLNADGLSIYGMVDVTRKGTLVPVVVTGVSRAKISGLCQSVVVPIPVLGPYTLRLTGGEQSQVQAKNLFLDATSLSIGQANFDNIDIGVAAGSVSKGPINPADKDSRFFDPNGFAQQANSAVLSNVHATTVAVSAATFNVPDLDVRLKQGHHECF
ncbi:DUF6230 family protein [Streptomyces sp. NBC_01408]|uniref:DUF6230 family protein n=1 Tax=Streptomyces sp. NBC_01408 TaxID=2903855 RepID=UPI0022545FC5|nr:DUF6230 family protein [Streptomyces sp. NBC_01408]MCX4695668.1 DUF6230 family protein [Streptomyces sp. NBC_01408]